MSRRSLTIAIALLLGLVLTAAPHAQQKNHSFTVDLNSAIVCLDGAQFVGEPTDAAALNLLMTSQIFDPAGPTLLATGDSHTFTAVGEQFTFTVLYPMGTFNVGDQAGISVSDIPPTVAGDEGFYDTTVVVECMIGVPALPTAGLFLLILLVALSGFFVARRMRVTA